MSLRYVHVTAKTGFVDTLKAIADESDSVIDCSVGPEHEGRQTLSMLVGLEDRQKLLDRIQSVLGSDETWRVIVLPVEATIPIPEEPPEGDEKRKKKKTTETREELLDEIDKGARIDANYLLLVVLSTAVATIGLSADNVAVIIGAMVIAPLLGPNLALILGTALGDRGLMLRAAKTGFVGVALTLAIAFGIGLALPIDLESRELLTRTDIGLDGVALALASGAAAALSMTTGLSSTLVGVMVAVALLPPTAALGLMLAAGRFDLALGAGLLLAVNIVCVNLAGQIVFLAQGIKPRTWIEERNARYSTAINLTVWAICLAVLVAVLLLR
jgi:uncharacterized hydrophobic protein (TIGR00341 family)